MNRCLCLLLGVMAVVSCRLDAEHVVIAGGPALRAWEDLREDKYRHDRWWANFIRASTIRIDQLRKQPDADAQIVWIVYRPSYVQRGREDGKPYVEWIEELANKRRVKLVWFSSGEGFIRALNSRPQRSIRTLDFFGHSNKFAFMFEYGADIIGSSTAWLHQDDLGKLRRSVFRSDAVCVSWGCHTGESMSEAWKKVLGMPLRGVQGATNYTSVGEGKLPLAKGPWTE